MPPDSTAKLAQKLAHQRDITVEYRLIEGANHFFHNRLDELMAEVERYLDRALAPEMAAAGAWR